jgi:DUF4097 and DUF4098 domain-containing protein YvlB
MEGNFMNKWIIPGILSFVLLLLCIGVAMIGFFLLRDGHYRNYNFGGHPRISAEADEEKRFTINGIAALKIENSSGKIVVTAGDTKTILVSAHKTAYGDNSGEAKDALSSLKVDMVQQGDEVSLKFKQPDTFSQNQYHKVDFTVTVPLETKVKIETGSGDISLKGTKGDADLQSSFGNISATQIKGALKLVSTNGKVEAGDITAGDGIVDLQSQFGAITLENITAGDITVSTSNGSVKLKNVEAGREVKIESNFGEIRYENGRADRVFAETDNGRVMLADLTIKGLLTAHSQFGPLNLKQVIAGETSLDTSNGAISIDGAVGKVKAHSDFGSIEVLNGKDATLDLTTQNGPVKYSGSLGTGPHTLSSSYGRIDLEIPSSSALTIDLKTDFGKVNSSLPVMLNGNLENAHWTGTINNGGAKLNATSNNGDIRISTLH